MRTRVFNGKEQIFCDWRHKWVRLTPEEWVRQQLLHRLVDEYGYPSSLIAVEVAFQLPNNSDQLPINAKRFRADAVVYNTAMLPLVLIECKAETVPLTQKTLDQAIIYNRKLNVPYLILHNGLQTICVNGNNINTSGIPRYTDLLRCE